MLTKCLHIIAILGFMSEPSCMVRIWKLNGIYLVMYDRKPIVVAWWRSKIWWRAQTLLRNIPQGTQATLGLKYNPSPKGERVVNIPER